MAKLFGFSIKEDPQDKMLNKHSPVPVNNDDGVTPIAGGGQVGYSLNLDIASKSEFDLIRRYRSMALQPEIDQAIDDITNEAIVSDSKDVPVRIDLSNMDVSETVKQIIRSEFKYILSMLDFNNKSQDIFRKFYIDGRLYYQKVIDLDQPERGVLELRYIDPLCIKPVREIKSAANDRNTSKQPTYSSNDSAAFGKISALQPEQYDEYFIYSRTGFGNYFGNQGGTSGVNGQAQNGGSSYNQFGPGKNKQAVPIARDSVAYVTSGLVDGNTGSVLSWLNKAIKPLNQLRMLEDSTVIHRVVRAPERRVVYIDVGGLPATKAEEHIRTQMNRLKSKVTYDSSTGEMKDGRYFMSMLEDIFLPRYGGNKGTEIKTLPGSDSLSNMEFLQYYQDNLFRALNIPLTRQQAAQGMSFGRSGEILRDEVKFAKFVAKMRKRFSLLFTDILKTQLILKGICSPKEFEEIKEHIQYDYIYDNQYAELKELEITMERMNVAAATEPYIGKYFSTYYIRHNILGMSDDEIAEIDQQVQYERQVGIIAAAQADMAQGGGAATANQEMDAETEQPPQEPGPDSGNQQIDNPEPPAQ